MNNSDDKNIVVEGETVADESGQVNVLMNLEQMIKNHITSIDKLKEEAKKHKGMLNDELLNNATYQDHDAKAKEANRIKSATKSQIMKQPNMMELVAKVKTMKLEVKELEIALSDYLREYERLSGSNEIEGDDGEVREIVYTAKLVKKGYKAK